MAKIIKLTPEYIDEIKKEFEESLGLAKISDGKINFTKTFRSVKREATIFFTELAWLKMQTLIREFDKEVAWHGIAKRGDDLEKDEYYITDILVYPQEVTGATVTTDQKKYQMWLMEHDDDVFCNIRMQGHSHVNMGTSPSSVDTSFYDEILDQLTDDMFYIFMIWNKKGDKTIKIYDMQKNVLFETSDCTVKVLDDGTGIERFLRDAKDMVKDRAVHIASSTKNNSQKDDAKIANFKNTSGIRKGRRKGNANNTSYKQCNKYDDSDWDNPYDAFGCREKYDW